MSNNRSNKGWLITILCFTSLLGLVYYKMNRILTKSPTGTLLIETTVSTNNSVTSITNKEETHIPVRCIEDFTWPGLQTGGTYRSR